MKKTLILGSPGTGKTRRLLDVVKGALRRGVRPDRIAYVTFTNAAEDHARALACEEFGFADDDLPYFRTIHSLTFRELGLSRSDVLCEEHLAELSKVTGELVTEDALFVPDRSADPLLTVDHYARTTRVGLRAAWEAGADVEWHRLKRFSEAYRLYKEDRGLLDFTDMLEEYARAALPPVPVEVAVIDEYQDLTALQVEVAARAFAAAEEVWVAGDDDQSVHRWAGAAEDAMLALDCPREVLPLSHRLPRQVFDLSQEIVRRIERRFPKPTRPSDKEGLVEWLANPEDADLSSGTWLMLGRTRAALPALAAVARDQGATYSVKGKSAVDAEHVAAIRAHEALRAGKEVGADDAALALKWSGRTAPLEESRSYTAESIGYDAAPIWHDALTKIPLDDREYYLACLRRGEKLTAPPRVRIETIHGAKGAEADGVVLLTDMTARVRRGYEADPDGEHRVFYVGATRASERLFPVIPRGPGYPL